MGLAKHRMLNIDETTQWLVQLHRPLNGTNIPITDLHVYALPSLILVEELGARLMVIDVLPNDRLG